MNEESFIQVLVAEDNDISRELIVTILQGKGYKVLEATDGQSAMDVVRSNQVHLALVDINMQPKGGFQFVEYLVAQGIDLPVIVITASNSSDILTQASSLGVAQVIQKPIDPERLTQAVGRILKRRGVNPAPLAVEKHDTKLSPEDLMRRVIEMAKDNALSGKGRPFSALVTDKDGIILGEGANRSSSRVDPVAHAEVMAIRQAAEKLGKADLSGCTLYCSSQPTGIGEALVKSVGIQQVYYGLTHEEVVGLAEYSHSSGADVTYTALCRDEAQAMFMSVQSETRETQEI